MATVRTPAPAAPVGTDDLRRYYNESVDYVALMQSHDSEYFATYLDLVRAYSTGCTRLLEIGCGAGTSTRAIAQALPATHCTGVDISESGISFAQRQDPLPNLAFAVADVARLQYPDGHFCLVTSCDCLEHVPDLGRTLRELMRVVRPGGRIIVKGPNHMSPLVTVVDALALRYRYPFTASWGDNLPRLAFQMRHFASGLAGAVEFVPRIPDLSDQIQVGDDADAVTDMSTITVRNFFRREGWRVLRTAWPRRRGWAGRALAGVVPLWASMGVVAERPAAR
jgi:ubiquinone/menaquinone biosynthesis C-methylase UbiE